MDISRFLSKVLGIYFIIVSLAMILNMQHFNLYVTNLINDTPLMFVTGFFTLIIGLLLVVSHNIWQWNWRVLITIIGWIILLKGISLIFYPEFIDKTAVLFVQSKTMAYVAASFDFVLGVVFSYFGFKR